MGGCWEKLATPSLPHLGAWGWPRMSCRFGIRSPVWLRAPAVVGYAGGSLGRTPDGSFRCPGPYPAHMPRIPKDRAEEASRLGFRVIVSFDPDTVDPDRVCVHDPAAPIEHLTSYATCRLWEREERRGPRYTAWPDTLPWLVGDGRTAEEALAHLAALLRTESSWQPEKGRANPLALGPRSLNTEELTALLASASAPPVLSDDYALVLRP